MIANMLRRRPEDVEDAPRPASPRAGEDDDDDDDELIQTDPLPTSNGSKIANERTPLLKMAPVEAPSPDYLHGGSDLEHQGCKERKSWPKLRHVWSNPCEEVIQFLRTLKIPKSWDRKTIWQNVAVIPGYIPAIILGTLLTILDALSYGTFSFFSRFMHFNPVGAEA